MNNNLFYVFLTGWQGMTQKGLDKAIPYAICETLEQARKACDKAWKEELAEDEAAYIYHDGYLGEDCEWMD